MKTNLQFSPMLLCLCQAVKTEHWRSLEFWWEQMISLWLALWVQSREFNYMVRGASCGDQLAEDLAPDPTPHHNSNPRFVGTSVGDAPLVPLHLHHSSPAPKDIGFGPKVNNSLTHLNSENIWRTRLLWKCCQIFHIAVFAHHHNPPNTRPRDYSQVSWDCKKNRSASCYMKN